MCGIVGIASNHFQENREWLSKGIKKINHRGPDSSGEWWSKNKTIGFGHTRLSILDLSSSGHQPMRHKGRDLTIIFNGEIYNYLDLKKELINAGFRFHSKSDTEVLMASYIYWGESCVKKFNGMFAFAIYDGKKNNLFFARDRAGEKPLYYRYNENTLQFSSELKSLLENKINPRRLSKKALDCFLGMGFIPKDFCILEGYNKLPAGHSMTFDIENNKLKIRRYWDLPQFQSQEVVNKQELKEELKYLLTDSISKQLIADVPLGICLSGGLDSSIITAIAAEQINDIHTYNVVMPSDEKLNESKHAKLISDYFGTKHTTIKASAPSEKTLIDLIRQFDEPIADSSILPTYMLSKLIKNHCTVAIGGDGGDELFGGYGFYSRILKLNNLNSKVPNFILSLINFLFDKCTPLGMPGRNFVSDLSVDYIKNLPSHLNLFDSTSRKAMMSKADKSYLVSESVYKNHIPHGKNLIENLTRMDFNFYLPEDILVKIDRASMMNSLELRSPFLDYRIIEFAFKKLPSILKVCGDHKKIFLKELAKDILPKKFDYNRKQGFSIPLDSWLKEKSMHTLVREVLMDKDSIFDYRFIKKLLQNQRLGFKNSERIFALLQFEIWRSSYGVNY